MATMAQPTHYLVQNGALVRELRMTDANARALLREESRTFRGMELIPGPCKYDTRHQGHIYRTATA